MPGRALRPCAVACMDGSVADNAQPVVPQRASFMGTLLLTANISGTAYSPGSV